MTAPIPTTVRARCGRCGTPLPALPFFRYATDVQQRLCRHCGALWQVTVKPLGSRPMGDTGQMFAHEVTLLQLNVGAEEPGLVQRRQARSTKTTVSIWDDRIAGDLNDPDTPWSTICEEHGGIVGHFRLADAKAWAAHPEDWCPTCQENHR